MRRYPLVWWMLVVFIAGVSGFIVTSSISSAEASVKRFKGMTSVAVLERSLPPGSILTSADIRTESRPRAFLPDVKPILDPVGRTLTTWVSAGDIVHELNAGGVGLSPTAALIRHDERAVALSLQNLQSALRIGDLVDVLVTFDDHGVESIPTTVIVEGARIVQLDDNSVMVAVPVDHTSKVAFAAAKGHVTLALSSAQAEIRGTPGKDSTDVSGSE